jgi:putative transposase
MRKLVLQAYRFALDPNDAQEGLLRSNAGARRFAYNWGLDLVKACYDQREAEKTYGTPAGDLTEVPWTAYSLRKRFNAVKETAAPWWREVSKEAFSDGFAGLGAALKNFATSKSGKRKGKVVGFPRKKRKGKARDSFRYTTGAYGPSDDNHVTLPRIGAVRTHESLAALQGARVKGVTVSRTAQRWYVSCTVEVVREIPDSPSRRQGRNGTVGVDLGVKSLAVLSTGEVVEAGDHHERALGRLKLAGQAFARSQPDSKNRATRARRLAKIHAGVACARADDLHKLTARLARDFEVVAIEDLNVAGMLRNRRLARSIADGSFGEFRRQLEYKTGWYGSRLHVVGRFYPSSKTCSGCGWRKPNLKLSERTYTCDRCGLSIDRDVNAATNLERHYAASAAGRARGATRKTESDMAASRQEAVKQEAGVRVHTQTSSPTGQLVGAA